MIYAISAFLLEEDRNGVVLAMLPGSEARVLVGDRLQILADIAAGRERTETRVWDQHVVVWQMPVHEPFMIGHFWRADSGEFRGYYVNLQEPWRRSAMGFDALDHVLDIIVAPDGVWRWKDDDELEHAVRCGMFDRAEAAGFKRHGEAVVTRLSNLIPTGWEDWRPDPAWPPLALPPGWDTVESD